jgi:drug/metabolite transporter (DMT)-like permease
MPRQNIAAYAALCASVLFWGLSFTATKVALTNLAPFTILFLRFALACAVLAPVAAAGKLRGLTLADHAGIFGISILFPGCYFALETFALRLTSATSASLISATIPMAVLALCAVVSRERPPLRNVLGVAASLAGVCLLVGLRGGAGNFVNTGDALMLGAVASAAAYMVAASRLCRSVSPLALTTLQMFWGTLFFLPFFLADLPDWKVVPAAPLLAVAGLGLFATVGAFLAYNFALSRVPAQTASLFINAVPVVAVFGAHLALSESVAVTQLAGGAMILASVYATASQPARERLSNTS